MIEPVSGKVVRDIYTCLFNRPHHIFGISIENNTIALTSYSDKLMWKADGGSWKVARVIG